MNTLLHMAKKWKIEVAIKEEELDKGGPDDKPFPTRASHLNRRGNRTVTNSLNFFAPDVKEWGQAPIQATVGLEAIDHGTQACRQTGENKTIMSEAERILSSAVSHARAFDVASRRKAAGSKV